MLAMSSRLFEYKLGEIFGSIGTFVGYFAIICVIMAFFNFLGKRTGKSFVTFILVVLVTALILTEIPLLNNSGNLSH